MGPVMLAAPGMAPQYATYALPPAYYPQGMGGRGVWGGGGVYHKHWG